VKSHTISSILSQLCDRRVSARFHFKAQSHSSVIWAGGKPDISPIYCSYVPSDWAGTKLYWLVTEAHVCEQLAQGCYQAVEQPGVEPATSRSLVGHTTATSRSHTDC